MTVTEEGFFDMDMTNLDFHNFWPEVLKTHIVRIARLSYMPGFPKYSHI